MTQFSLQMGMMPVVISGLLQGFGLGCTFVPLNIIVLSNLPRHILTQGTAIRSVMRAIESPKRSGERPTSGLRLPAGGGMAREASARSYQILARGRRSAA